MEHIYRVQFIDNITNEVINTMYYLTENDTRWVYDCKNRSNRVLVSVIRVEKSTTEYKSAVDNSKTEEYYNDTYKSALEIIEEEKKIETNTELKLLHLLKFCNENQTT